MPKPKHTAFLEQKMDEFRLIRENAANELAESVILTDDGPTVSISVARAAVLQERRTLANELISDIEGELLADPKMGEGQDEPAA